MEHTSHVPDDDDCDADLDPRIQIELEKLNNATDDINKLETELDDANTTFRLLLNESTRRLKFLSKKLGSCIERARPYYEALEVARQAQMECQRAAVQFQRANEIHQAAKETVALAEQRFLSKQHEWQFDNAWQEMLNHATIKVMEAETQKAESGREHQKRATLFNAAEQKVQELEQRLRRSISRSRPYFEEKALCQEQLAAQKSRVENLQKAVTSTKQAYAESLRELERISEEIHFKRAGLGLREPGVGAELASLPVYELELDRCDRRSMGSMSAGDDSEPLDEYEERDLEQLKQSVQALVARPPESGDGVELSWEKELATSVTLLHQLSVSEADIPGCENLTPNKDLEVAATHIENDKPDIRELENLQNSKSDNVQVESLPKKVVERRREREDLELSALKLLCNSPKSGSPLHISNRWSETK